MLQKRSFLLHQHPLRGRLWQLLVWVCGGRAQWQRKHHSNQWVQRWNFYRWLNSCTGDNKSSLLPGLPVILESPAAPVTEGDSVTLRCRSENTSTSPSGIRPDFYKDGILVRSSSSANMTLHSVSKASEGLYKCNISDKGESLQSWLIVQGEVTVK